MDIKTSITNLAGALLVGTNYIIFNILFLSLTALPTKKFLLIQLAIA
jgi:hypothetical protein